jgi:hypothetical protein
MILAAGCEARGEFFLTRALPETAHFRNPREFPIFEQNST